MSMLPVVASTDSLVTEVFMSIETKNRYEVDMPDGRTILYAQEQGSGGMAFLRRDFLYFERKSN